MEHFPQSSRNSPCKDLEAFLQECGHKWPVTDADDDGVHDDKDTMIDIDDSNSGESEEAKMSNKVNSIIEGLDYSRSYWNDTQKVLKHGELYAIKESGLFRIKRHSENGFFTISAFRGADKDGNVISYKDNMARTKKLEADIKSAGLGFIQLYGGWVEKDEKTGEDRQVEEVSLFVPYKDGYDVKKFVALAEKLAKKYDQEGYIVCSPEDKIITLYNRGKLVDGGDFESESKGPFKISKMPDYYSRLRKAGQSKIKYVFEGVRTPNNAFDAMMLSRSGHLL